MDAACVLEITSRRTKIMHIFMKVWGVNIKGEKKSYDGVVVRALDL